MPRKASRKTTDRTEAAPAGTAGAFQPFADDAAVRNLGDLSIENGTTRIAIHGSLDLTRDRVGLERAQALKATFDAIVAALQAQDLPETVAEEIQAPKTVKNPFA